MVPKVYWQHPLKVPATLSTIPLPLSTNSYFGPTEYPKGSDVFFPPKKSEMRLGGGGEPYVARDYSIGLPYTLPISDYDWMILQRTHLNGPNEKFQSMRLSVIDSFPHGNTCLNHRMNTESREIPGLGLLEQSQQRGSHTQRRLVSEITQNNIPPLPELTIHLWYAVVPTLPQQTYSLSEEDLIISSTR